VSTAAPVAYIGNEIDAAGYRLAGVDARVPRAGGEAECFAAARSEYALVLMDGAIAARIPAETLEAALAAPAPLVMIVPGSTPGEGPASAAEKVRRLLGAET
jgi:vacuolar-type H+-ATPase subunit F/Vma7